MEFRTIYIDHKLKVPYTMQPIRPTKTSLQMVLYLGLSDSGLAFTKIFDLCCNRQLVATSNAPLLDRLSKASVGHQIVVGIYIGFVILFLIQYDVRQSLN